MIRKLVILALAGLLIAAMAIAGCGGSSTGSADVTSENSTRSATSDTSGVPVYPGAKEVDMADGSWRPDGMRQPPDGGFPQGSAPEGMPDPRADGSSPGGSAPDGDMTMLWTADDASEVSEWYKEQLSGKQDFTQGSAPSRGAEQAASGTMFSFTSGGETKTVMVRENNMNSKGGTLVTIGAGRPGGPSPGK